MLRRPLPHTLLLLRACAVALTERDLLRGMSVRSGCLVSGAGVRRRRSAQSFHMHYIRGGDGTVDGTHLRRQDGRSLCSASLSCSESSSEFSGGRDSSPPLPPERAGRNRVTSGPRALPTTEAVLSKLQVQIEDLVAHMAIPAELQRAHQCELLRLEALAQDLFGRGARLVPFGSLPAGLGTAQSDLDVALSLGNSWDEALFAQGAVGAARHVPAPSPSGASAIGVSLGAPQKQGMEREGLLVKGRKRGQKRRNDDPGRQERVRVLKRLGRGIRRHLKIPVEAILSARVPIISVTTSAGLRIDISAQTSVHVGSLTAEMLRTLVTSDRSVRDATLIVKTWAKARSINSAFEGTIPSMGYVIMFLHTLLRTQAIPDLMPARTADMSWRGRGHRVEVWRSDGVRTQLVLPFRRETGDCDGDVDGRKCIVSAPKPAECAISHGQETRTSTRAAQLLLSFFEHFSGAAAWTGSRVSARALPEADMPRPRCPLGDSNGLYVEDPFDESNNVARCLSRSGVLEVRAEISRAYALLLAGSDLDSVLTPKKISGDATRVQRAAGLGIRRARGGKGRSRRRKRMTWW